jgi:hypothetical protein
MGDIPRSVALKFARVGEHMAALSEAIDTFLSTEPYGTKREIEQNGREHVFFWTKYEECPDRLGLIAGDAIHNLRSSLDHMVVALAIEGAKTSGRTLGWDDLTRLQFPVVTSCQRSLKTEPKRSPKSEPVRCHYSSTAPSVTDGRLFNPESRSR